MDRNTIQYDHMYVQTTPLLLFRRTNKNCYVNIIEHAEAKVIASTCMFLYYDNISVLILFFLLNIKDELTVICGGYNRETILLPILLALLKERTYVTVLHKLLRYNLLEATLTVAPMGISLHAIL